jgi:hypothetical protein
MRFFVLQKLVIIIDRFLIEVYCAIYFTVSIYQGRCDGRVKNFELAGILCSGQLGSHRSGMGELAIRAVKRRTIQPTFAAGTERNVGTVMAICNSWIRACYVTIDYFITFCTSVVGSVIVRYVN